jgi:hypothetical protein
MDSSSFFTGGFNLTASAVLQRIRDGGTIPPRRRFSEVFVNNSDCGHRGITFALCLGVL